jgi:NAD(P)-dependent dehydrogenase (short-subunit alcohol dehydrogenase family)
MTAPGERIALVTGASRGIGRAVALALAASGAHVVALARTVGGLEELDDAIRTSGSGSATLVPVDLKDGPAIDRLGAALYERFHHLDVLFANAGVLGPVTPVAHIDPKAWDMTVAVNLTSAFRLIRALHPLLLAAPEARALFVSSSEAAASKPFLGLYAATKAGLEAMVASYAGEVAHTSIRANLINPGPLRTRMRAELMPGEDPAQVAPPEAIVPDVLRMLSRDYTETGVVFDFPTRRTTARLRREPVPTPA